MRRHAISAAVGLLALLGTAAPATAEPPTVGDASLTAAATISAPQAWSQGITGDGVGIALIDTGVSPRPGQRDTVLGQINTSNSARPTDGHGHGTFMAGLMAGDDRLTGSLAISPDAEIVSVKVADEHGRTSLASVLTGITAVRMAADDLGIRVVLLALGGHADEIPDPIEAALEQLWDDGLVVVVASGNQAGTVTEPGVSPYLLTAGATDDRGTPSHHDDVVAAWSGSGVGRDGRLKPDVHAPGTSVVSSRIPGSLADRENPHSRIRGQWFRGSGTSMAAAITAGAAALVLDAEPTLSPDQVKGRLMASTSGNPTGTLNVARAISATGDPTANTHLPALGTEEPSAVSDQRAMAELQPVRITGDWDGASWIGASWIGKSWVGASWIELEWDGASWIGASWIDRDWKGASWIDNSWDGASWIGASWISDHWVGHSWTSVGFP